MMENEERPSATPTGGPQSEKDWTIHALNIHGEFFERSCQQVIRETPPWTLTTTNYPVAVDGHQSELDIRADLEVGNKRVILLIECKKNNPEFVNWIFFPKAPQTQTVILPSVERSGTHVRDFLYDRPFGPLPIPIADGGRETRGNYLAYSKQKSDKTRTSNTAIIDAAKQIALATESIYREEIHRAAGRRAPSSSDLTIIVPLIVTSAKLLLCSFNPEDVVVETGEVPLTRVVLSEVPHGVVYEYPLPKHLHATHDIQTLEFRSIERFVRRHVVVVQSARFSNFLGNDALQLLA
jgi:hypothetical protein